LREPGSFEHPLHVPPYVNLPKNVYDALSLRFAFPKRSGFHKIENGSLFVFSPRKSKEPHSM
jgi:hypothetical protein